MKKVMSGLKFKSEQYYKVWNKTYDERWVCDLGYFQISTAMYMDQRDFGPQAVLRFNNGHIQAEGVTLEAAIDSVITEFNLPENRRHADWGHTWPRALEDARKGRLNLKQRMALKEVLLPTIFALATILGLALFPLPNSTPKTTTCQCPCP